MGVAEGVNIDDLMVNRPGGIVRVDGMPGEKIMPLVTPDVTGRVLEANDAKLVLLVNPLNGQKAEIKRSDVARMEPSKLSAMPEGLVNILSKDEILDLLAYIESAGKREHAVFKKAGE